MGSWTGCFSQFGKLHPFALNMAFQGYNIAGQGQDSIGTFLIAGQLTPTGQVKFTKQYHGQQHAVAYDGQLTPDGKSMHGTYSVEGQVGSFIMTLQH